MDGVFPFEFRNRSIESVDKEREPNPWFPPDTKIEIRVILHPGHMAAVFTGYSANFAEYMENEAADALDPVPPVPQITFLEADLEYESLILKESVHANIMNQFYTKNARAVYDYDIVNSQHQALSGDATFTENSFQIPPKCRFLYIMFLPSHATFPMEDRKKPLSALARFPQYATNTKFIFAGQELIYAGGFKRLGEYDENHQISKRALFRYMKSKRIFPGEFEDLFPRENNINSVVQAIAYDCDHQMSEKQKF